MANMEAAKMVRFFLDLLSMRKLLGRRLASPQTVLWRGPGGQKTEAEISHRQNFPLSIRKAQADTVARCSVGFGCDALP
jgi:hypothetical protein